MESNNFMFGCINALNSQIKDIRVIHIVRNPVSYIRSHLNHKFWEGYKKIFARFFPFWLETEPFRKKDKKDPIIILAHRWHYINKTIEQLKLSNDYICIKFEDIFSKDMQIANSNLNKIRKFLNCSPLSAEKNAIWLNRPKNASKYFQTRYIIKSDHVEYINSGFTSMLKEYGYYPLTLGD